MTVALEISRSPDWWQTQDGSPRGSIQAHGMRELWFHTGTACNLACDFCLEGSKPGDTRLDLVKLDDVAPYIDAALALDVEQFSFTGGEPFLAKDIIKILALAAQHRPCLVLTNGTEAVQRRALELAPLTDAPHQISFRVSLDYPTAEDHDSGRGAGNFVQAVAGLRMLHEIGFPVSVARHMQPGEDGAAVAAAYAALFAANQLPATLSLVAFPDFALPGAHPQVPHITKNCMTAFQTEETRRNFMCAFSRMIVKQDGKMRIFACTLVDDDPDYDLGPDLAESLAEPISMKHHRCYSCFAYGSSCSEL